MKSINKFVKVFINNTDLDTVSNFQGSAERQMPGCHEEASDALYRENIYNLAVRKRRILRKRNTVLVGSSSSMSSSSA